MSVVRLAKDSSGLLLCRILDAAGAPVTNSSPSGTTCTVTLTAAKDNTVVLSAVSMTYDGSLTAIDPDDGALKTGWWKYALTAANTAQAGLHRARAVAVSGSTQRAKVWDVLIDEEV